MPTTWDEANRCPEDQYTGIVQSRKSYKGGGQIVTLTCPQTRCQYYEDPWIVQVRPDNTVPDRIDPNERRKANPRPKINQAAAQQARDILAQQVLAEQRPGYEVQG
jgi:hypothetical protein